MLFRNVLFAASALTLALSACTGDTNGDGDVINNEPESKETELTSEEGGVAESPDGSFAVALDGPELVDETVTVTVTEVEDTFNPDAALSPAYVVDVEGELAINFSADITFDLTAAKAEEVGVANIRVAHGETAGEAWDELLEGSYDSELEKYTLTVYSFSYFMLIDETEVNGNECTCDEDSECTADCECDDDCVNECTCDTDNLCTADCSCDDDCGPVDVTECSESCMSQSGSGCCTTCGCDFEVVCRPECGSGYEWDCELECCFDYENFVCEGDAS